MTWKRVVNRNGLSTGDYNTLPFHWQANRNLEAVSLLSDKEEVKADLFDSLAERLKLYERAMMTLLGDIRRLEADVLDEATICKQIAYRTQIDPDTVAAVLKEFMSI